MNEYLISEAAEKSGVNKETIRYYESMKLISLPKRNTSGYRLYSETVVERIQFIKRAQALGFTLKEIVELLSLENHPTQNSMPVRMLTLKKLEEVELKIAHLQGLQKTLQHLSGSCNGKTDVAHCPIIQSLEGIAAQGSKR